MLRIPDASTSRHGCFGARGITCNANLTKNKPPPPTQGVENGSTSRRKAIEIGKFSCPEMFILQPSTLAVQACLKVLGSEPFC